MSRTYKDLPVRIRWKDPRQLFPQKSPRWARRSCWYGPLRAHERAWSRRAVAEHLATGSVEAEPVLGYHHHNVDTLW